MDEEDKPFVCTDVGCGMRFTNEDHLSVHMRKHDMSLALNLSSLGGLSPIALFTDQTPTPTKFLKNCEEIGLFQDLKNPFEDSFKKAMDDSLDIENQTCNNLDTPQPGIPKIHVVREDSEDGSMAVEKKKDVSLASIVPKKRKKFLTQSMATSTTSEDEDDPVIGSSSTETESVSRADSQMKGENSPPSVSSSTGEAKSVIVSEAVELTPSPALGPVMVQVYLQLPGGQTIPVQVPATTLTPMQQKSINPQQIIQLPSVNPTPQPQVINVAKNLPHVVMPSTQVIQTVPANVVNQITSQPTQGVSVNMRHVKLDTSTQAQSSVASVIAQNTVGNQAPVKVSVTPEKQTIVHPAPVVIAQSVTPKVNQGGSQAYTKQRLKAALQQQTTPSSSQKISQIFQMVSEVKREPQMSPGPLDSSSFVSSSGSVSSPEDRSTPYGATPLGSVASDSGDDADVRRKKFLERNRAAAARCRMKRKRWVNNLENKADELTSINTKLSSEIKTLRGEIAQLKTLLLAHKDCPVTLQQRSQGQIPQQTHLQPAQAESSVVETEVSDIPTTVSSVTINSDMLPNIITVNQSSNFQTAPSTVNASLVPSIITLNPSTSASVANGGVATGIITLDQSDKPTFTHAAVSRDLIPSIIVDQTKAENQQLSVITGPNSISMIPKIINMDQLLHNQNNQKS